jgi:hypothetical protein
MELLRLGSDKGRMARIPKSPFALYGTDLHNAHIQLSLGTTPFRSENVLACRLKRYQYLFIAD